MSHPSPLLVGMVVAAAAAVVEVAGSRDLAMSAHRTIQQQEAAVVAVGALREVITGVVVDVGWGIAKGEAVLHGTWKWTIGSQISEFIYHRERRTSSLASAVVAQINRQ